MNYTFSKKRRNYVAAIALFPAHYNFCRIHYALRVPPCTAARVTNTVGPIGPQWPVPLQSKACRATEPLPANSG